jgi:uncharacterized protein (TIGR03905 family)
MKTVFETQGTCSRHILIDVDEKTGIINDVQFIGGCNGNTKGISSLVRGQKMDDVIGRLEGICCGAKSTSCPDQLAIALKGIKEDIGEQ